VSDTLHEEKEGTRLESQRKQGKNTSREEAKGKKKESLAVFFGSHFFFDSGFEFAFKKNYLVSERRRRARQCCWCGFSTKSVNWAAFAGSIGRFFFTCFSPNSIQYIIISRTSRLRVFLEVAWDGDGPVSRRAELRSLRHGRRRRVVKRHGRHDLLTLNW